MLAQTERLRKSGLFQRVYTGRKNVSSEFFTLYVLPKQGKASRKLPLAGFVIAKKTLAKACERNRVKRRMREAYRRVKQEKDKAVNFDETSADGLRDWYAIVFVAQARVLTASFEELLNAIKSSLDKAKRKYGKDKKVKPDWSP